MGAGGWFMARKLVQGGSMACSWVPNESSVDQCSFHTSPFFPNPCILQSPPSCPTVTETTVGHDTWIHLPKRTPESCCWSPPYPGWRKWSSGKILFHGRNGLPPCSLLGSEIYSGPGSATTSLGHLGQHTALFWASLFSPVNSFNKHAVQPKRRTRNMQVTKPWTWPPSRGAGRPGVMRTSYVSRLGVDNRDGGGQWTGEGCGQLVRAAIKWASCLSAPATLAKWERGPGIGKSLWYFSKEAGKTKLYMKCEQTNQISFICCLAEAHGPRICNS